MTKKPECMKGSNEEPKAYRNKSDNVDAIQFKGGASNATPIINWTLSSGCSATWTEAYEAHEFPNGKSYRASNEKLTIISPDIAVTRVHVGEWVIRGFDEVYFFFTLPDTEFKKKYERLPE